MAHFTLADFDLEKISPQMLGEILIDAKKAYYTTGKPIMDDHTYDTLETILQKINPYHRLFKKVGNPNFDTGFDKKVHTMPMGSQNKVTTFTELQKYFDLKKLPHTTDFIVEPKCDGISLEMQYLDGHLVDAITRGDGITGDVVTQNVTKMKNFVDHPDNFSGSVRCEIVVTASDFVKLNQSVGSEGLYSNPRNAASGLTQRLDGQYAEFCSLFAVDIFAPLPTESAKMDLLTKLGFTPVETFVCSDYQTIENVYQQFLTQKRLAYPFEIDGLVIKINNLELAFELGQKNNRPKSQVAYKFPAQSNQSRLLAIDWQVGPLGTVTPVAQIEPVEISGAVITYASLANYQLIKDKNINVGDVVEISRRGDVIPHVESVVIKVTPGISQPPSHCPECHTLLINDNKFLRCPNSVNCPAQTLGQLRLFCQTLDIKGISAKTILKLHTAGKINLPGDFYDLTVNDFVDLDGLGEKSGQNIVTQIQAKKNITVVEIFTAAAIPNFSQARIKQLVAAGFDTPQKLLNITISELESQPGIQITLANKIFAGLQLRRPTIESILSHIKINTKDLLLNTKLNGLNFVITGELSVSRKKIEADIEAAGGRIQTTVSSATSYLVTNETKSTSSKFTTAQKLGTAIISEDKLYQLINN